MTGWWLGVALVACGWGERRAERREERAEERRDEERRDEKRDRKDEPPTDEIADLDALEALGYVSGSTKLSDRTGVVVHEPSAVDGYNLVATGHGLEILLLDMDGDVVRAWRTRQGGAKGAGKDYFRRGIPLADGGVVGIIEADGIVRFGVDGREQWRTNDRNHHDLDEAPDGALWTLTRTTHLIPAIHPDEPISEDFVAVYEADGRQRRRFSVLSALLDTPFRQIFDRSPRQHGDVMHTNSIEVLDGRAAGRNAAFAKGNILISSRALSSIFVIDAGTEKVIWAHSGGHQRQHDARIVDDGLLMLFDNHSPQGPSAVVVYDPMDMREVWRWGGEAGSTWYSKTCGLASRLEGGGTLITITNEARAVEVDAAGKIVWEYRVPFTAVKREDLAADLFEVVRLPLSWPGAVARPRGR